MPKQLPKSKKHRYHVEAFDLGLPGEIALKTLLRTDELFEADFAANKYDAPSGEMAVVRVWDNDERKNVLVFVKPPAQQTVSIEDA